MSSSFEHRVAEYIRQHDLLDKSQRYIVALSGGADSVSLLLTLCHLGYSIEACHCNFHLRGEESDRDEHFCIDLCQHQQVPLHRIHFDTRSYADLHGVSIEMAARELRYRYFEQLMADLGAQGIAVAHHKDDSVETVLINLVRGTGIDGLTGISPRNGHILRPLLGVGRQDILSYLGQLGQDYVTDSTNLIPDVVRNKIRLTILPLLRDINPAVDDNIARTASHLEEASHMLQTSIAEAQLLSSQANGIDEIDKEKLLALGSPQYALHTLLAPYHFASAITNEMLASINTIGKSWYSSTHQAVIDRQKILIRERKEDDKPNSLKIPETGCYRWNENTLTRVTTYQRGEDFTPSREPLRATLDADKISFPLCLRTPSEGDRFVPFGMKGSKLISDYLTDCKCNVFEKESQLLIEDAQHRIVWVVGRRTSEVARIDDSTSQILEIWME